MKFYTLLLALLLAACTSSAPVPTQPPPTMERPIPTATSIPTTPEERGQVLFTTMQPEAGFACATCHYTDSETRLIGPGLLNIRERFTAYEMDTEFEDYLRNSILHPNEFIIPGTPPFPSGLMPQNYEVVFTEEQVNDIIAYLASLGG